jgi:Trypsin-like peptidase domain
MPRRALLVAVIALAACADPEPAPVGGGHSVLCDAPDIEGPPQRCYPDDPAVLDVSANVFMVERRGYVACTGWLVASRCSLYALTANHCIPSAAAAAQVTRLRFNYRARDACNGLDAGGHFTQPPPSTMMDTTLDLKGGFSWVAGVEEVDGKTLDFSLLRFDDATAARIRAFIEEDDTVTVGLPVTTHAMAACERGEPMFLLGHHMGRPQNVTYLDSGLNGQWAVPAVGLPMSGADVRVAANRARVGRYPDGGGGTLFAYTADSETGSSGAPVWGATSGAVIGLHVGLADDCANRAVAMSHILAYRPAADARSIAEILDCTGC